MHDGIDLPSDLKMHYTHMKVLPDGRICGVHRLMFHWTMHIGITLLGYEDRYCFDTFERVYQAFLDWDGIGDPEGWHRHPTSGRRRNLSTGEEWIAD